MPKARVTVTLPDVVVKEIDRHERNRSRFVLEAVEKELEHRRHQELLASLSSPHPQSGEIAERGLDEWADWGTDGDEELLDPKDGRSVRWSPDHGWTEDDD